MYEDAKYWGYGGQILSISVLINGERWSVPIDPNNSDYQNIMRLVEEGKLTIQPADDNK